MKKGGGLSSGDTAVPQVLREDAVRQCLTVTAQVVHGRMCNYLHLKFNKMVLLTGLFFLNMPFYYNLMAFLSEQGKLGVLKESLADKLRN